MLFNCFISGGKLLIEDKQLFSYKSLLEKLNGVSGFLEITDKEKMSADQRKMLYYLKVIVPFFQMRLPSVGWEHIDEETTDYWLRITIMPKDIVNLQTGDCIRIPNPKKRLPSAEWKEFIVDCVGLAFDMFQEFPPGASEYQINL